MFNMWFFRFSNLLTRGFTSWVSALICFFNDCRIIFYSVSPTFRFEAYAYVLVSRRSIDFHEMRTKNGYFTLHCNFINWLVYLFYLCLCR